MFCFRWLIANGKHEEVDKIYKKMAKMNGTNITGANVSIYKELNVGNHQTVCAIFFLFHKTSNKTKNGYIRTPYHINVKLIFFWLINLWYVNNC